MELAVIGRRLCEPLTGVGRYLNRLLCHWARLDVPFERIVVYVPREPTDCDDIFGGAIEMRIVPSRLPPLAWENLALSGRLESADLIFGAYTVPIDRAADSVVSNLGIYESRPDDFSITARLRTTPLFWNSALNARLALANSNSTREDLVEYFGVDRRRVEVVHLGVDECFRPAVSPTHLLPSAVLAKYHLPAAPFLLFVGKLSKRRNIPWLIEAFARVKTAGDMPERLVVIGPGAVDVRGLAARFGVADSIDYIAHVPVNELKVFYQAARGLVHPTLHEGFSLPVVEALACGTPVVTFDHASLECGLRDDVVIAEPSPGRLAAGIRKIIEPGASPATRSHAEDVRKRFNWRKTAETTMSHLARAVANEWW